MSLTLLRMNSLYSWEFEEIVWWFGLLLSSQFNTVAPTLHSYNNLRILVAVVSNLVATANQLCSSYVAPYATSSSIYLILQYLDGPL